MVLTEGAHGGHALSDEGRDGAADTSADTSTLFLFHGERTGWVIVREGTVVARASSREEFEQALRWQLRRLLLDRFPGSVLLSGRLFQDGPRTTLEVGLSPWSAHHSSDTDEVSGAGKSEPPLLVLLRDAPGSDAVRSFPADGLLGMRWASADVAPDRMMLCDRSESDQPALDARITRDEALPWFLSSPMGFGPEPALGLSRLIDLADRCGEIVWSGSHERLNSSIDSRTSRLEPFPGRFASVSTQEDSAGALAMPATAAPPASCVDVDGEDASTPVERPQEERRPPRWPRVREGVLLVEASPYWIAVSPQWGVPLLLDAQSKAVLDAFDGETSLEDLVDVVSEVFREDRGRTRTTLSGLIDVMTGAGLIGEERDGQGGADIGERLANKLNLDHPIEERRRA